MLHPRLTWTVVNFNKNGTPFQNGAHHFTAPANLPTSPIGIVDPGVGSGEMQYHYYVEVALPHGKVCKVDPIVIIDDGHMIPTEGQLKATADNAKAVFAALIETLKKNADGPTPRLFFPNGIELIKVEFDVGKSGTVASATVVVAGKDGVPGAKTLQLRLDDEGEAEASPAL